MTWWINFCKDLVERSEVTTGNDLEMECHWFCFGNLLQQDLDHVKEGWNSHYIHSSWHETVPGRPNALYYLPEMYGTQNFLHPVNADKCQHVEENHLILEYFQYFTDQCNLGLPQAWTEGLHLYNRLLHLANEP